MATVSKEEASAGPSLPPAKRTKPQDDKECADHEIVKKQHIEEDQEKEGASSEEEEDMEKYEEDDSDDGVDDSDDEISEEDYKEYSRLIGESEGYDCGRFKGTFYHKIIQADECAHEVIELKKHVKEALEKYNRDENTQFEFKSIEKVNAQVANVTRYFFTFKVTDPEDGSDKIFQCRVHDTIRGLDIEQVRPKPAAG